MPALARKCEKIFMAVLSTSDPGKAIAQNATVQIAVDHGAQIGTVKPIGPLNALLIDLFKFLKMILNTLVMGRILRPAKTVGTVFRSPFTPLLGQMLYRDRHCLRSVVHRRFEIFPLRIVYICRPSIPLLYEVNKPRSASQV